MTKGPFQPHDFTPDDKAGDLFWASMFRSVPDEVMKGGVLVNDPKIDHGLKIERASSQYLQYALNSQFSNIIRWSFHVWFLPTFEPTDGLSHYIFDTDLTNRFYFRKQGDDVIRIRVPTGSIATINLVDYQAAWRTGEWNLFSFAAESGQQFGWLNTVEVEDTATVIAMNGASTDLYVGAANTPADYFDGQIALLKMYDAMLTVDEHIAMFSRGI